MSRKESSLLFEKEGRTRLILIWFPVVMLSISNELIALTTPSSLTMSTAWILGAVVEELLFRFFLLRQIFLRTMNRTLAILLVSILFAGMHLFNLRAGQPLDQTLLQCFAAFAFSIWAGAVTWKSTWLIPLLAHVLMNATATDNISWMCLMISTVVLVDGLILMKGENLQ